MARRETTQMRTVIRPGGTALPDTTMVGLQGATSRHQVASQVGMAVHHSTDILRAEARRQVADRPQTMVGHLRVGTTHAVHHQTHAVHRRAHLHMEHRHLHMVRRHQSMALLGRLRHRTPQVALHLATVRRRLATVHRLLVMEPLHQAMVRHLRAMELHPQATHRHLATVPPLLVTARRLLVMVLLVVLLEGPLQATDLRQGMGLLPVTDRRPQATDHHQVLEGLPPVMNLAATLVE